MPANMDNAYLDELYGRCGSYLTTYIKILKGAEEALELGDGSRLTGYADLEFLYGGKLKSCISTIEGLLKTNGGIFPENLRTMAANAQQLSSAMQDRMSCELASVQRSLKDVQSRMRTVGVCANRASRTENRYISISA